MGDAVGTCARSGHVRLAARHPTTMKKFFTGTNFLISILVQYLWGNRRLVGGIRGQLFGPEANWRLVALWRVEIAKPEHPSIDL
jgi:hypothetical protein